VPSIITVFNRFSVENKHSVNIGRNLNRFAYAGKLKAIKTIYFNKQNASGDLSMKNEKFHRA
jgi:hypothetical protein